MTNLSIYTLTRTTPQVDTDRADDWRELASCREQPISYEWDPWFPVSKPGHVSTYTIAKRICDGCPVKAICLTEALAEEADAPRPRYGMRGGLTPDERDALPQPARGSHLGPACKDRKGTTAGERRHRRAKQAPCDECREAANRDKREKAALKRAEAAS